MDITHLSASLVSNFFKLGSPQKLQLGNDAEVDFTKPFTVERVLKMVHRCASIVSEECQVSCPRTCISLNQIL